MSTLLFLAEGFEEIEALATVDILRRADISVFTVSITEEKKVIGKNGVAVIADKVFEEIIDTKADMLILPGGPGVASLNEHQGLKKLIKKYYVQGKWIAAICAAPTILGKLGLLEERKAVCYPGLEKDLKGAIIPEDEVLSLDAKIITSKGPGTTFVFALKIVEVLKGAEVAREVGSGMIYLGDL
ncbi:MAG: DJ-1/PfpI family protein [Firmicutes bacterium]|nr:DJ-1/PfpI family protein [Bacillota bacterium]